MMENLEQSLGKAVLFKGLTTEELRPIAQAAHEVSLKSNALLFSAGDPAAAFFLVVAGSVRLYRLSPDGKEKVIEIIRPGETFAEAMVFLDRPYPVFASAIGRALLISIPTEVVRSHIRQNTDLAFKMLAALSMRLHKFLNDIHALSLSSAQQRVAGYLLAFLDEDGDDRTVQLPANKTLIASRLGLQPETFSRVLGKLKEQGVIVEHQGQVVVAMPEELRRFRDEPDGKGLL